MESWNYPEYSPLVEQNTTDNNSEYNKDTRYIILNKSFIFTLRIYNNTLTF